MNIGPDEARILLKAISHKPLANEDWPILTMLTALLSDEAKRVAVPPYSPHMPGETEPDF